MKRAALLASLLAIGAAGLGLALHDRPELTAQAAGTRPVAAAVEKTRLGLNLFGPATYNWQQVFTNLIAQSEWFASRGAGWQVFPADRLDADGWVRVKLGNKISNDQFDADWMPPILQRRKGLG